MLSEQEIKEARTQKTTWWPLGVNPIIEAPQGWQQEEYAWNHNASIWYLKIPFNFFRLTGPDAQKLLEKTCVNKFSNPRPGTVKQVLSCNDDGKLVLDTLCLVRGENDYELSGYPTRFQYVNETYGPYDVEFGEAPSRTFIQVTGPKSFDLLGELTDYDLTTIRFGHFVEGIMLGGCEVRMCRFDMTNELGFEIEGDPADYEKIVGAIFEVGEKYGLVQVGARSHLVQHAEGGQLSNGYGDAIAAYFDEGDPYRDYLVKNDPYTSLTGMDTPRITGSYEPKDWSDFYVSPVEMGATRRIDFSHDFIGKEALEKEAADPKRTFVTLEWNKEDVIDVYASMFADGEPHERLDTPHYDYMEIPRDPRLPIEASKVLVDGEEVAFTTARTYMYSFRRMVSNCLIPIEYSEPGTQVTIIWGEPGHPQKEIRGTVQTLPYKPFAYKSLPSDQRPAKK